VLKHILSSLIQLIVAGNEDSPNEIPITNAARALLALIHQRHAEILRNAVGEIIRGGESADEGEDQRMNEKERKKKANELMISFSVVSLSMYPCADKAEHISESSVGSKYGCQ